MKQTVYLNDFRSAFDKMNRKENFSYEGLEKLFEYFEQLEEDIGEEVELDVIAICCDFTEYENFKELRKQHNVDSLYDLMDKTTVILVDDDDYGRIIIKDY